MNIFGALSFFEWLKTIWEYAIALIVFVVGLYLAYGIESANPIITKLLKPLHFIGVVLMIAGAAFGYGTMRESRGAANCEASWKAKGYEATIAKLKQEAAGKDIAAKEAADQTDQLARDNDDKQALIEQYRAAQGNSPDCRRATDDDDRRLCQLTGNSAPGCKSAR